jgi:hypothetical protein
VDQRTGRVWRRQLTGEKPWDLIDEADVRGGAAVLEDLLESPTLPESAESAVD